MVPWSNELAQRCGGRAATFICLRTWKICTRTILLEEQSHVEGKGVREKKGDRADFLDLEES